MSMRAPHNDRRSLEAQRRYPPPWSDLIWINTRAFALRLDLHARVSVSVACWTFDAAIFLYDTWMRTGRG
jgi:hypothetical protein